MELQHSLSWRHYAVLLSLLAILVGCTATGAATPATDIEMLPTIGSPTQTPEPPTAASHPTLTADEKQVFVMDKLRTNGGCELPCWWGISPGETTWQSMKDSFISQGIQWFYEDELNFDPPLPERPVWYSIHLSFVQQAGLVHTIKVWGEVLGDPGTNHFAQDWSRYSLDQVLRVHL